MEEPNKAETHESLSIKLNAKRSQISELEAKLQSYKNIEPEKDALDKPPSIDEEDELDAFMSNLKSSVKPVSTIRLEQEILELRKVCLFFRGVFFFVCT